MKYLYKYKNFTINKIEYSKDYFSILIEDHKNRISFWIDCGLTDGYGNHICNDFNKHEELFIDWEFNQYIFYLYNENDLNAKQYQETAANIENIDDFIMSFEAELVEKFLKYKEVE